MEKNSLYECVKSDSGMRYTTAGEALLCKPIEQGVILTLRGTGHDKGIDGLYFEEIINHIHPVIGRECGYDQRKFKKIQDPMQIDISELQHQTQTV